MRIAPLHLFLFLSFLISCNKSASSEEAPKDSGVNLTGKTPEKGTTAAHAPRAGSLMIDEAGLAAGTEKQDAKPESQLSLASSSEVSNLCKSCGEIRKEISDFQKRTQKASLEPALTTLLGSSNLCSDMNSLQDLQDGLEKQIDTFNNTPLNDGAQAGEAEVATNIVDMVNSANDLRDKVRTHISQFEPLRSNTSTVEAMKRQCP